MKSFARQQQPDRGKASASQLVDQRRGTSAQRATKDPGPQARALETLQEQANENPRARHVAQMQEGFDASPRTHQRMDMEDEYLQGKFSPVQRQGELDEEDLMLQGKFDTNAAAAQLESVTGGGENQTGMPDRLKTGLEQLSGMDLSGVRVHHNSPEPAQLNAHAYTQGQDIHVAPGQEQHLPHEGWHAVQQMGGRVQPTMQAHGVQINDDRTLEREADVMGGKAAKVPPRQLQQLRTPE